MSIELKEQASLQVELRRVAKKIVSNLSDLEPAQSKELLEDFVSELYLSAAEQERRTVRRQRQAEGIASAKERGVQFGRERMELPEGFPELARLWQEGGISSRRAAEALGINYKTFMRRAKEYCTI